MRRVIEKCYRDSASCSTSFRTGQKGDIHECHPVKHFPSVIPAAGDRHPFLRQVTPCESIFTGNTSPSLSAADGEERPELHRQRIDRARIG